MLLEISKQLGGALDWQFAVLVLVPGDDQGSRLQRGAEETRGGNDGEPEKANEFRADFESDQTLQYEEGVDGQNNKENKKLRHN